MVRRSEPIVRQTMTTKVVWGMQVSPRLVDVTAVEDGEDQCAALVVHEVMSQQIVRMVQLRLRSVTPAVIIVARRVGLISRCDVV